MCGELNRFRPKTSQKNINFRVFINIRLYVVKSSMQLTQKSRNKNSLHSCCHMISKIRIYMQVRFKTSCETSLFPRLLKLSHIQWLRQMILFHEKRCYLSIPRLFITGPFLLNKQKLLSVHFYSVLFVTNFNFQ